MERIEITKWVRPNGDVYEIETVYDHRGLVAYQNKTRLK